MFASRARALYPGGEKPGDIEQIKKAYTGSVFTLCLLESARVRARQTQSKYSNLTHLLQKEYSLCVSCICSVFLEYLLYVSGKYRKSICDTGRVSALCLVKDLFSVSESIHSVSPVFALCF